VDPLDDAAEDHALAEGGEDRARGEGKVPIAVTRLRDAAELERHAAEDEGEEHDDHRQVKRRHDHRIGSRKRHEKAAASEHQPGLVAVPEGRERAHHHVAILLPAGEGKEDADAEVEAVEDDVEGDRGGDEERPDDREVGFHWPQLPLSGTAAASSVAAVSGRFGTPCGGGACGLGPFRMRRLM
jgi:hypothetical protein